MDVRAGPDVPTPLSDGKLLYVVRDNGVVFALDVKTGATIYGPERLPSGTYSASMILADPKSPSRPKGRQDDRVPRGTEVRNPGHSRRQRRHEAREVRRRAF